MSELERYRISFFHTLEGGLDRNGNLRGFDVELFQLCERTGYLILSNAS
jgi:hypothetical protein